MNAHEIVKLAALVSTHGPALIEGDRPLFQEHLNDYWASSKTRQDNWCRDIKQYIDQYPTLNPHGREKS